MDNQPTRVLRDWIIYVIVFLLAGGVAAGLCALLYEAVVGEPFSSTLYAVIFGGSGFIAYQTLRPSHR